MIKKTLLPTILFLSLFLAACGEKAAPDSEVAAVPPTFTLTVDLCSEENLPAEAGKVNKLMREFDDYSILASSTPQTQLIQIIPDLQRILRDAEDQSVPACLDNLKQLQLNHMRTVVQTLIAFMSATDETGVEVINAGIAQARSFHEQYDIEMARLLGITLAAPPPTFTPAPVATP